MDSLPHGLRHDRHVDLTARRGEPWARRALISLLAAVVVAALFDVAGQGAATRHAEAAAATLTVKAPTRVRGGLFFQGRFDIVAREHLSRPTIVLGNGWTEEMQLNTIEPSPKSETSSDGELELEFDPMRSGEHLTLWLQFEVNPNGVGRRDRGVTLRDGERTIAHIPGKITVAP
jgi:hypothetical protein